MPPGARSCVRVRGARFDLDGDGAEATVATNGTATTASSYHRGGVNVAFGDGSVQFVTDDISVTAWRMMGSRDGVDAPTDRRG